MNNNVIHIEHLSFGYSSRELIIKDLNLNVQEGAIYGFLGANGAGKTTTLKMILSLINSYDGNISVFGKNIKSEYPQFLKQIGSLIENPSFYGHLSATDNLKIWSKYYQADQNRIPEVLEMLDLSNASNKKTEHFSTGMKQRLGLATALLHDPQLLILDEPTNGLDPMGIIELRKVLKRLKQEGKTIVLSSHILSEVEKMVTHLGILKEGAIVFEGSIDELHARRDSNIELSLEVDDSKVAIDFIDARIKKVVSGNTIIVQVDNKEQIPQLINKLNDQGIKIYEVKRSNQSLESMFLSISKESQT